MAQREQSRGVEARRGQLQGECHAVIQAGTQAIDILKSQDRGEVQRLERLEQRIAQRFAQERNRRQVLQNQRRQCLAVLAEAQAVRRAECRLSLAERVCRCVRHRSEHGANRSNA
jgi:exonuclease SbcC